MPEAWSPGSRLPRACHMHHLQASWASRHVPWPPIQETRATSIHVGKRNVLHPSFAATSIQPKPVCSKCNSSAHPDCSGVEQPHPHSTGPSQHHRLTPVTTLCSNKDRGRGRRQHSPYSRPLHRQPGHKREKGNLPLDPR